MLERQIVIPASPERLWDALTEPSSLRDWFGSEVEWDLRPGGQARFREEDGSLRRGLVEAVFPGRHLSFRWWRDDEAAGASRVTYTLEPEEDGTRLTVTEQQVAVPAGAHAGDGPAGPVASALSTASRPAPELRATWTSWDGRLLRMWAAAAAPARAVASR